MKLWIKFFVCFGCGCIFGAYVFSQFKISRGGALANFAEKELEHDGDVCQAFESIIQANMDMRERTSDFVASFYAQGICVEQNIERAERFYSVNKMSSVDIGEALFVQAHILLSRESEKTFNSVPIRERVLKLLKRSKDLGVNFTDRYKNYVSKEQLDFIQKRF